MKNNPEFMKLALSWFKALDVANVCNKDMCEQHMYYFLFRYYGFNF